MSVFASPRFLPNVMWADAASCAATGALQVAFTDALARLTGLPAPLLMGTGVFLLAYAALAAFMASRSTPPRALIGLVVVGNFGWAVACVALLVSGMFPVTEAHDICDRLERAIKAEVQDALISIHVEPDDKAKHSGIVVL